MKAEWKGLVEGESSFEVVCGHLEMLGNDEHNEKAAADYAKKQVVPMDLSTVSQMPKEVGAPEPAAATASDEPAAALDAVADMSCYKCSGNRHWALDRTKGRR